MALSAKTSKNLAVALSNKSASTELQALVAARSGTPSRVLTQCLCDALISRSTRGNGLLPSVGFEVLAALTSGANLTLKARQRILSMMAGDATPAGGAHAAGNELINFIQSVPQSKNTTL